MPAVIKHMVRAIKRLLARRALQRTMRPDPDHRTRRLAQFSTERQLRYWENVRAIYDGMGREC